MRVALIHSAQPGNQYAGGPTGVGGYVSGLEAGERP